MNRMKKWFLGIVMFMSVLILNGIIKGEQIVYAADPTIASKTISIEANAVKVTFSIAIPDGTTRSQYCYVGPSSTSVGTYDADGSTRSKTFTTKVTDTGNMTYIQSECEAAAIAAVTFKGSVKVSKVGANTGTVTANGTTMSGLTATATGVDYIESYNYEYNYRIVASYSGGTLVEGTSVTTSMVNTTLQQQKVTIPVYAHGGEKTSEKTTGSWTTKTSNVEETIKSHSTTAGTRNVTVTYTYSGTTYSTSFSVTWIEDYITSYNYSYNYRIVASYSGGTLYEGQSVTTSMVNTALQEQKVTKPVYASKGEASEDEWTTGSWTTKTSNVGETIGTHSTTIGTRNVTVTYTYSGTTYSTTVSVTWVEDTIVSSVVKSTLYKLEATYNGGNLIEGISIDPTTIAAIYSKKDTMTNTHASGKTSETVKDWEVVTSSASVTLGTYATTPGTRDVTVTYGQASDIISVTWVRKNLKSIDATYTGANIVEGGTYNKGDVSIVITYDNNTTETLNGASINTKESRAISFSFTPTTVSSSEGETVTVTCSYTGREAKTATDTFKVPGVKKDLSSITVSYEGNAIVEEMSVPLNKIKVTASYNNGTSSVFYVSAPKTHTPTVTGSVDNVSITNEDGSKLYDYTSGLSQLVTTRYSENNGSVTYTISFTYTGSKQVTASDDITVEVLPKTPTKLVATYPSSKIVTQGTEFDRGDVTLTVTYNNGTKYVFAADGTIISGYTNEGEPIPRTVIYSLYALNPDEDYAGDDTEYWKGENWDLYVTESGDNTFAAEFTENGVTVSTSFVVTTIEKVPVKIEAEYIGTPVTVGLEYSKGDVILYVTYDNGSVGVLKGSSNNVVLTDSNGKENCSVTKVGTNTYQAELQGCKDSFDVTGKEAILTSIYVLKRQNQMFYTEGDSFDKTGIIVMATFSDLREGQIPEDSLVVVDGEHLALDQEYVTLSYTVGGITKTTKTPIFVDIGGLSYLYIKQNPYQTTYNPGDDFNPNGMIVMAGYTTGMEREIQVGEYEVIGGEHLESGTVFVTISYEENNVVVTAEVQIYVKPKGLSSIEVLREPNKTSYYPGENFLSAGMAITAHYTDGSVAVVTDKCVILDGTNMPSGKQTVTVSYTEEKAGESITKTALINIQVADADIDHIVASYIGQKVKVGEAFNPSDVMITVYYADGTEETFTGMKEGVNFSQLIIKNVNNSVTVTYRGHTTAIQIPVSNAENNEAQTVTEIVSRGTWKERFTVKKTRTVEDYYISGGYKIPYLRKGNETDKVNNLDIQFKVYAEEMGGWTTWYNSGEMISTGNYGAMKLKLGLVNGVGLTLSGTVNGTSYSNIQPGSEFVNPQIVKFTLNGDTDMKLQYRVYYGTTSTDWVDQGTAVGSSGKTIMGIGFRLVEK